MDPTIGHACISQLPGRDAEVSMIKWIDSVSKSLKRGSSLSLTPRRGHDQNANRGTSARRQSGVESDIFPDYSITQAIM